MDQFFLHGRKRHRGRRGLLALAFVVGATLLAGTGQAYAQTTPDSGAVDQYVEDVPTAGGSTVPSTGAGEDEAIQPSVATQINQQGGTDAPALTKVASSSKYGAGAFGEDVSGAAPEADLSSTAAAASAVSAVQGAGTARLAGFLFVLFGISIATLVAATLRQRRAAVRA
jgi:hypothetical protein